MIFVLLLAKLFDGLTALCGRAGSALYVAYYAHLELHRLKSDRRRAIDDLIAETRPVSRVGSPLHRGR